MRTKEFKALLTTATTTTTTSTTASVTSTCLSIKKHIYELSINCKQELYFIYTLKNYHNSLNCNFLLSFQWVSVLMSLTNAIQALCPAAYSVIFLSHWKKLIGKNYSTAFSKKFQINNLFCRIKINIFVFTN